MKIILKKEYRGCYKVTSKLFNGTIDKCENDWILTTDNNEYNGDHFETLKSFKEFCEKYFNEIE